LREFEKWKFLLFIKLSMQIDILGSNDNMMIVKPTIK